MLLLKRKTFEIESSSPVVTEEEAKALSDAGEIIRAAEEEALRIKEEARLAYEAEKKRGYDDGISDGKADILMQKFDIIDESVRYMESVETKMAMIVMKALKKCIAEIGDDEIIRQIVKKSMQAVVRNQRQITVKVNSLDLAAVRERIGAITAEFPSVAIADVVEDNHLGRGACIVETEAGIVEASVEGQLKAIENSIKKNFSKEN